MSVQVSSESTSLFGIIIWEWGLRISFLSGDIDLLNDTDEMPASLTSSCL